MSEVIGTILLVGTTLVMSTGFAFLLVDGMPGPQEELVARLEVTLVQDACPWGDGDERVRLRHLGGESLPAGSTVVRITAGADEHLFEGSTLGGPFSSQGRLSIGGTWQSDPLFLETGTPVFVDVAARSGDASLVVSETLHVPQRCVGGSA